MQNRNVKGTAAQIVDQDLLVQTPIEAVRERSRSGLIHDSLNVEARQTSCLFYGLALVVVVIGRDRNDGGGNRSPQKLLRYRLDLRQNEAGDFRKSIGFPGEIDRRLAIRSFDNLVVKIVF